MRSSDVAALIEVAAPGWDRWRCRGCLMERCRRSQGGRSIGCRATAKRERESE